MQGMIGPNSKSEVQQGRHQALQLHVRHLKFVTDSLPGPILPALLPDVGFPSVICEYILLTLANKEASSAYGKAE